MSSLHLSRFNPGFQVDDKNGHTRLMITKIDFSAYPQDRVPAGMQLEIEDENGIMLFNELIEPFLMKELAGKVAYIHREFAIFNHLTVRLTAAEPNTDFEAEIYFVLSS